MKTIIHFHAMVNAITRPGCDEKILVNGDTLMIKGTAHAGNLHVVLTGSKGHLNVTGRLCVNGDCFTDKRSQKSN